MHDAGAVTNHHLDDSTPAEAERTGDAASSAASGPWLSAPNRS